MNGSQSRPAVVSARLTGVCICICVCVYVCSPARCQASAGESRNNVNVKINFDISCHADAAKLDPDQHQLFAHTHSHKHRHQLSGTCYYNTSLRTYFSVSEPSAASVVHLCSRAAVLPLLTPRDTPHQ